MIMDETRTSYSIRAVEREEEESVSPRRFCLVRVLAAKAWKEGKREIERERERERERLKEGRYFRILELGKTALHKHWDTE